MRSVFSLRVGIIYGVGYLVPLYEESTHYSFSRIDLKYHRYCTRDGCAEQLQRTLNRPFLEI